MKRWITRVLALWLFAMVMVACGAPDTTAPDTETTSPAPDTDTASPSPAAEDDMASPSPEDDMASPEAEASPAVSPDAEASPEASPDAAGAAGDLGTEENPIIMSFVPSGDTQEIVASGDEIAAMIEERTDLAIDANVATSYAAVVEAMGAGNAHVGWLNTFGYVLANERYGVDVALATVRFGEPFYRGQIIANADAGIETLEDIQGKTICWVDPLSTSGYIIPRIMLEAAGLDVDGLESQEAGSHPNVVTAVYNGDCDAGATFVDARTAIAEEFPDVNERVIVVEESPEIPNDTVAFAEDVPEEVREQIVSALLEIAETEEGQEALNTLYEIEGFQEVDDSFYDEFRTELDASGINIEELAQ